LADHFQLEIIFADTLCEGADRLQDGTKSRPERLRDVLRCFVVEASGRALGQPCSKGLDCSTDVVDQLRTAPDQRLTRADDRKMSLGVFAAVFEWIKQFRIKTCEASEVLGIYLVSLALVCVDQPRLARVGHQHPMATLLEHPANPRGVGSRLYGYAQWLLL